VENSSSYGNARPTIKKPAEHQMTLPMHSPLAQSVVSVAPLAASVSAPVSEPLDVSDTEVEIDDSGIHRYPPLPSLLTPAPVFARAAQVATPITPAPDSRPVIRPPVASPIATASATSSARRTTSSSPTALATAHLGIEESEYDKPTYLRRAMAGEGVRLPGDGKA
jgi:hypothetical protein